MSDKVTKYRRSEIMRSVKSENTKPELIVRSFLYARGFRYRLHLKYLHGSPDIYLRKYNCVIFINGCFWHGHKNCSIYATPKTNVIFWKNKIARNMERDVSNINNLREAGLNVIIIWECELKKSKREKTLNKVVKQIINGI